MHGEAVSIGMVLAAKIAEKIYPSKGTFASQLKTDLINTGLPVEVPASIKMQNMIEAITKDKKVTGANINFILPKGIGNVEDISIPIKKLEEISYDLY